MLEDAADLWKRTSDVPVNVNIVRRNAEDVTFIMSFDWSTQDDQQANKRAKINC